MHNRRSNKAIEIDFEAEHQKHVDYIKSQIGKPVPLSHAYTKANIQSWSPSTVTKRLSDMGTGLS